MRLSCDRGILWASGLVRVGVFEFRRPETMAGAKAVHLSEERLNLPLPRHLRKLIDCRDHHGWRQPVDLFIDNQQREPLVGRLPSRELALTKRVTTIDQRARPSRRIWLHDDMLSRID